MIREKVDCVEEPKGEINDACSQVVVMFLMVVMLVMVVMVVMIVLVDMVAMMFLMVVMMVLMDMAVMVTMGMAMTIKRFLSTRKMKSFSQVSECPTKDCYNDMEIPPSESSSPGEAGGSN